MMILMMMLMVILMFVVGGGLWCTVLVFCVSYSLPQFGSLITVGKVKLLIPQEMKPDQTV